jgi:hypothetical protein
LLKVVASMKVITLLLCLGLALPASANSLEDALCKTVSSPVEQMAHSEKLCRSFVLALGQVPDTAAAEIQALLTPKNLATMASLSAAWLGTQGVPIVGQAVDAALFTIGVVLLAAQAADLSRALWEYANLSIGARSRSDLEAAATHLARAISLAGINVVTFILTKKVATKLNQRPPSAPPQPATPRGTPALGSEASTRAPVLASVIMRPFKVLDLKAFASWIAGAQKRVVNAKTPAMEYQSARAGKQEVLVKGGGEEIWADGARMDDAHLLEVKHVEKPDSSPFIAGSTCEEFIRSMIREKERIQLRRYAAVIGDPETPAVGLEIIVNDARAAPFFEALMHELGIPGRVAVRP